MKSPSHDADGTPDPASRGETLREHLEDIKAIGEFVGSHAVTERAAAALAILDRAERTVIQCGMTSACERTVLGAHVFVHDPQVVSPLTPEQWDEANGWSTP